MKDKMTKEEWINKCNWEGGLIKGLIYGLDETDLDDSDSEFNALVKKSANAFKKFRAISDELESLVMEGEG